MNDIQATRRKLLAAMLAGGGLLPACWAQTTPAPPRLASPPASALRSRYHPDRFAGRAKTYYELVWGVDSLNVKWAESGEMIRFAWRVLDADKARMLNVESAEPALIDVQAGVSLVVPQMENVGRLRQSGTPESGKTYWMAFSNKGRRVRRGDHVIVQIGQFRADGLVVD